MQPRGAWRSSSQLRWLPSRGVGGPHATVGGIVVSLALVLLLLVGAWLLADFVRKHGDEIGEARFDTRNKDECDG